MSDWYPSLVSVYSPSALCAPRRRTVPCGVYVLNMEIFKNDSSSFGQFLERFCQDHSGVVGQGECLPYRLVNYYLLESEYEAECADWALQYLNAKYETTFVDPLAL